MDITESMKLLLNSDTYGLFEMTTDNHYNFVYCTSDIKKFNTEFSSILINLIKDQGSACYLLFRSDDVNPKLDDVELVRLSYPCAEIKINGIDIDIKGNFNLCKQTVYSYPFINRLISFRCTKKNIMTLRKSELKALSKNNRNKLSAKNTLRNKLLNQETENMLKELLG